MAPQNIGASRSVKDLKAERLASALKANLKRRKGQARERAVLGQDNVQQPEKTR